MDWSLDRDAMVVFALRWAPFGGGDAADIWTEFGVPVEEFYRRLHLILSAPVPAGIDELMWARLKALCEHRLAPVDPDTPPDAQVSA